MRGLFFILQHLAQSDTSDTIPTPHNRIDTQFPHAKSMPQYNFVDIYLPFFTPIKNNICNRTYVLQTLRVVILLLLKMLVHYKIWSN